MRRYRSLLLIVLVVIVPFTVLLASVWLYLGQEPPPLSESVEVPLPSPGPVGPPPVEVRAAARDLLVGTLLTAAVPEACRAPDLSRWEVLQRYGKGEI